MNVFITSDIHYNHKNLIESLRSMKVDNCNDIIVNNINRLVKFKDTLIILGDLTMDKPDSAIEFLNRINCRDIIIVAGNHDTRRVCKKIIDSIILNKNISIVGSYDYKGFLLTHIPVHPNCLDRYRGNIHGHIHINEEANIKDKLYYNVNIELHDYNPVEFKQILNNYENI